MASRYHLLPKSRVNRSIRMAFIKAKAQIPVDTGTLRGALVAQERPNGYKISFIDERVNPKNRKKVGEYKQYPDIRGRSAGYWKRFRDAFYADLSRQLKSPLRKRGGK